MATIFRLLIRFLVLAAELWWIMRLVSIITNWVVFVASKFGVRPSTVLRYRYLPLRHRNSLLRASSEPMLKYPLLIVGLVEQAFQAEVYQQGAA